ncbi:MAG: tetratricopeptide repeat protein [Ferruginibacter sp.]
MKKLLFSFLVLLLLQPSGYAQQLSKRNIDSLLVLLATAKEDTTKLNLLAEIMGEHLSYNPKEGLRYGEEALSLAKKSNSQGAIAIIKRQTGSLNWRIGNFDRAIQDHLMSLDIYSRLGNKYGEGQVLVDIAQDHLDSGSYPKAMTYLQKALKVSSAAGDKPTMSNAYDVLNYLYELEGNMEESVKAKYAYLKINEELDNKIGIAHGAAGLAFNFKTLGNDAEALKYFKQALQAANDLGDKMEEAYMWGNVGDIYIERRNFAEATQQYTEALRLANELEDIRLLGDIHRGMGNLYQAQGRFNEALDNYLVAEKQFRSFGNKQGLASLYTEIGIAYTRLKKFGQARQSFESALLLCGELNSKVELAGYYKGMALFDSATGNWKDAYLHHIRYVTLRDSSFNKETLKKLVASQMQYENDKKEAVIKAAQEKKDVIAREEVKRQRNIRNSTFAVLAVVLLFSIVIYRQRNKIAGQKKQSDQLVRDKEMLIREVHHRVKNNLEVVSSLLALQSDQLDDPNTKEAMQEGQNRVHSIGIVHQKLYQGNDLGAIEMKDYFINLSESILDSFGADQRVQVECAMDALDIDIDTAVPLGLIVNELLTNTLKYAFPNGRNGKVQIKLERRKDGILRLQVSDNGVGKSGLTKGTGFGGQLIALLTRQLSGSMREENNNGTSVFFEFKIGAAA